MNERTYEGKTFAKAETARAKFTEAATRIGVGFCNWTVVSDPVTGRFYVWAYGFSSMQDAINLAHCNIAVYCTN